MADWHLDTLHHHLTQRGWRVEPQPGDGLDSWSLERGSISLLIDFDAHDTMGNAILSLDKAHGCQVREQGSLSLYFYSKQSPKWKPALSRFIDGLDEVGQDSPLQEG